MSNPILTPGLEAVMDDINAARLAELSAGCDPFLPLLEPDAETILIRGRVCCSTCGRGTEAAPCPDHQPREAARLEVCS